MLRANSGWRRVVHIAIFLAMCASGIAAQVLQLSGGTSTLYQSQGGSISFYSPNYNAKMGFGFVNGQASGGATLNKITKDATYTIGDDYIGLALPTDIFSSARYLLMTGAGFKATRANTDIVAFAGLSATYLGSSLFDGARAEKPAALLSLNRTLNREWTSTTDVLVTQRTTLLQGLQWAPSKDLRLAASGGIGANQPYGSASALIHKHWIDVKAAYIGAGNQFHIIGIESQYSAEPNRENVSITVRPFKYLSFTGGRQNFLVPAYQSLVQSSSQMNQISTNATLEHVHLSAGEVQSKYGNTVNDSTILMAEREFAPLRTDIHASYIHSETPGNQPTKLFLLTAKEVLSPRWGVNQTLNVLNGNPTMNFGGSFLSNILSVSVNYETFYIPTNIKAPFQESIVATAQSTLFGRLRLHGNTFVDQLGHIRYTADASLIASRAGAKPAAHMSLGKYVIRGRVIDPKGNPVEGAALLFDQMPVFTNSMGTFVVREHKARTHRVTVLGDQFLDVYHYDVVAAPETLTSTAAEDDPGATLIVKRTVKKNFCVHLCDIGPQSHAVPPPPPVPAQPSSGPQTLNLLPPSPPQLPAIGPQSRNIPAPMPMIPPGD